MEKKGKKTKRRTAVPRLAESIDLSDVIQGDTILAKQTAVNNLYNRHPLTIKFSLNQRK
jgi:hypothetical protein